MAQTMIDALILCGLDSNPIIFNGETIPTRVSSDIFDDSFMTCMDKTRTELEDSWKTYAQLTVNQGQIRLRPQEKKKVRALVHWVREQIRLGRDPAAVPFPVHETQDILHREKNHEAWMDKAPSKAKTTLPKQFTEKMKWMDWKDSFLNFLRTQPGRNGVPLSYIVRDNQQPIIRANQEFLDTYIDQAPLTGDAFISDADEVHIYIVKFIAENSTAENKILPFLQLKNGRADYNALKDHYEGVGATAKAVVSSEADIQDMFYAGEKKPHMWWEEFETRLTVAFAKLDKYEGRQVHSDEAKLRLLNRKVQADFLQMVRNGIELEMTKTPMIMTYNIALSNYRNAVNRKFPPGSDTKKTRRNIHETNTRDGGRGGRGGGGGRGRGRGRGGNGYQGRGRGRGRGGTRNKRTDAWFIQCSDGTRLEVHPSYSFTDEVWGKIPDEVKRDLMQRREAYKRQRQASQAYRGYGQHYHPYGNHNHHQHNHQDQQNQHQNFAPAGSVVSEITTQNQGQDQSQSQGSIMGGRNEQQQLRSRNSANRSASNVRSKRKVASYESTSNVSVPSEGTISDCEADTNADTCCLGSSFLPIAFTNRTADVYPYDSSYQPVTNVPIVSGATAYDHPDGNTYILVFHEALYYGSKLSHSLINGHKRGLYICGPHIR